MCGGPLPNQVLTARWFDKARGKAMGFAYLGIGVGGNFVTERNLSLNQAQKIPGYELLNAALYYRIDKFQIQFNMNNILDKTYWVGGYDYLRLFPGAPRNWLATVAYTF